MGSSWTGSFLSKERQLQLILQLISFLDYYYFFYLPAVKKPESCVL